MFIAVRALLGLVVAVIMAGFLSGCGGGGVAPPPEGQYIVLLGGKVAVEQGEGVILIKASESQLPGVEFGQDSVEANLYEGDLFEDPRKEEQDVPPLRKFRVSRTGVLLDELRLPAGRYTATVENVRVVQNGKEFRCALSAYVFDVFLSGGKFRTTLPLKFDAKFPAIGTVIQDAYVSFLTDEGAVGGTARLFMQHANGTVDMHRTFIGQTEQGIPVAAVSFEALPGGPTLGNVSRLVLKAFKP